MKVDKKNEKKNSILRKLVIVLFWLLVWQIISCIIGNVIILEGPIGVVKRLLEDLQTGEYYRTVGSSLLRINSGFLCGLILAVLCSVCAWKQKVIEEVLAPVIQFLKAAPITCFVVLLLIWAGSVNLAFYISLLVTFPPIYFNLLEGLKQLDVKYVEVAKVYRMPYTNRMKYIYLPGVEPYFISAVTLAIGTAFKAGVAAEIIGTPEYSMGEHIYMSKIYLDTAGVFSWMFTVILVAYLCEKIYIRFTKLFFGKCHIKEKQICGHSRTKRMAQASIGLINCTLSYNKEIVLKNISMDFQCGKTYGIMGQSGIGKTTLLKALWGFMKPSAGEVVGNDCIKAGVFQENRLFEEYTALENVYATRQCTLDVETVKNALSELLPKESLIKPVKEYSGGMKRRVEVARAMLSDSPVILMDEPFNGMDEETKEKTILFIRKYKKDRMILFTTHCQTDIEKVKAEEFNL